MKLTLSGIQDTEKFQKACIALPGYNVNLAQQKAVEEPQWVHFGIGNIFRVFIAGIADELLEQGLIDRGITCVETFDSEVVERVYRPFDNLGLSVILNNDGTREMKVLGSMAEAIDASAQRDRLKKIFRSASLQMISFTITEKGYQLLDTNGKLLPYISSEMEGSLEDVKTAMPLLASMLYERWLAGGKPVALISMDNCAQNGKLLKSSVMMVANAWRKDGKVEESFIEWLSDENKVAFDSTMIDKITPRPSDEIADDLEKLGLCDMKPVVTSKRTYIAPFINAEKPQYLVIEDRFPNGRPALEKGFGVYMGDFDTVCKCERMKVTACLNPAHTAVGPLGVVLGQERFADMLRDLPVTLQMAKQVIYGEGIPVVQDPGILSPKAFADEVFERFTNLNLGDTNLRLATDASQGLGVRFGETIKSYMEKKGTASMLTAIPLGIAGFFRYMMGVDDMGRQYELAPDPLAESMHESLSTVKLGEPDSLTGQLQPWLSNESVFHVNLYEAGLGHKIEDMLREMIASEGATLRTIKKYIE